MELTIDQWIAYGIEHGYCSDIFCLTHDGWPLSETEEELFDEGSDPCGHGVRLGNMTQWETEARDFKDFMPND